MQKRFHDIGSIISFYENRQNVSSKFLSRDELYSFSLRDGDPIIQSLCLKYHFSKCWPLLLDMPCLTFVQFIQFKKREKHRWRNVTFSNFASACNFTKRSTPPWVFFIFFRLHNWYQIAQPIHLNFHFSLNDLLELNLVLEQ